MELLLFLSAMLAGFTGLISGDRAVDARQVERTAIATSAVVEAGVRIVDSATRTRVVLPAARAAFRAASAPRPAATPVAVPQTAPVDERRLE